MFSEKILLFLIASTFFLQYTSQEKQVNLRGTPEVDYPTYYAIPKTSFSCTDQLHNPGFYADTEARCQVFHYCYKHRQESFLCPMGTTFNQPILACDYWYSSNCSLAPSYYNVNAIKRNEYHLDEVEDPIISPSENVLNKMADLYETNEASKLPVPHNVSLMPENEFGKDGSEPSNELAVENNSKAEDYNKYTYDQEFNMIDEKYPEIVKYNIMGINSVDAHEGSENEEPYEADNIKDFFFSEDGMLHPIQEDFYQIYPTDMNFDQEYSGYAEIPREENVNYDLNADFSSESDFEIPDFELQRRHSDISGSYFRKRPSNRKPIIFSEEQPEIVPLPVTKHRRKPTEIASTVSTIPDVDSSHETTYNPNMYNEEIVSVANEVLDATAPGEFPLNESNINFSYEFTDSKQLHESQEEIEDSSKLYQIDSSSAIYDSSTENMNRNEYILSNVDEEISSNVYGSDNDLLSISNIEHSALGYSKHGDKTEIFSENVKNSIVLPDESSNTIDKGSNFDNEPFLGSGSEENIIQPHLSNILSDNSVTETSYVLPMDLLNTFEGSGVSDQIAGDTSNFDEKVNEPIQFVLKEDFESNNEYNAELSSLGTFETFSPSEILKNNDGEELVLDGSGEFSEFNYLPLQFPESSEYSMDESLKTVQENQETNGAYYIFPDSEYPSNFEYGPSNGFDSEATDYAADENFEDNVDKAPEDFADSEGFQQDSKEDSKLKIDYIEDEMLHTFDYQGSRDLENAYENISNELETEIELESSNTNELDSSNISEEYTVDDSEISEKFSNEDLKYLKIMAQTPVPMLKNLFEVSEKSNSEGITDEMFLEENLSEKNIDGTLGDTTNLEELYEFKNLFSDVSSNPKENSDDMESSEIHTKILDTEQKIPEEASNANEFVQEGTDVILTKQKITEEASDPNDFDQDGTEVILLEENFEVSAPEKETDPFNPLFAGSNVILDGPGNKHQMSMKVPLIKTLKSPVLKNDLNKVSRGKRLSENLQTFNPSKKSMISPRQDTFREAIFTSIPSEFLKMKHSTLRPYFYNYGLKNSGFHPRTGDLFGPSKLSKLTSLGKRLWAAKRAKFNLMKNYIDSYRK